MRIPRDSPSPADPTPLALAIEAAWPRAQAYWSQFLLLRPPVENSLQPSVARIHLGTRQIELNARLIAEKDLLGSVEAMLAHEIGHHVRYPGSLAVDARLRLIERTLLPIEGYSVINLFTDLLINERLGAWLREPLVRVYRAFAAEVSAAWEEDPAFLFYLAIYEELWQLEPGDLAGPGRAEFERAHPGARADAQMLAQDLFALGSNLYTQFLLFVAIVSRYVRIPSEEGAKGLSPYSCNGDEPTAEDWADALLPDAREAEAIRRAIAEGWITPRQGKLLGGPGALARRVIGLPGQGGDDAELVPEIMAAYYRRQAEKYLLRPPPVRTLGEAVVPTTHEEWEPGDPVREIDWLATLIARGAELGPVLPVKRLKVADEAGFDVPFWQPRIEIYLDVSGSMPDPRTTQNALTLAAQILAMASIRAGGWARALLYSGAHVAYWQWCRSETELSRFLMHYIGGGTEFPFDVLAASVEECGADQPIRVVITDTDFDHNFGARADNRQVLAAAISRSPHLVLLQHLPDPAHASLYRSMGARVIAIEAMDDFPRMAADLARALFAERGTDGQS